MVSPGQGEDVWPVAVTLVHQPLLPLQASWRLPEAVAVAEHLMAAAAARHALVVHPLAAAPAAASGCIARAAASSHPSARTGTVVGQGQKASPPELVAEQLAAPGTVELVWALQARQTPQIMHRHGVSITNTL